MIIGISEKATQQKILQSCKKRVADPFYKGDNFAQNSVCASTPLVNKQHPVI